MDDQDRLNDSYEAYRTAPDDASLETLYKQLRVNAQKIISARLRRQEPELASDIATDTYFKLQQFQRDCQFSTWFYRLVENKITDYLRKLRGKEISLSRTELSNLFYQEVSEKATLLDRVKESLSEETFALLELRLSGWTIAEIAEKEGVSNSCIKHRVVKLRECLSKLLEERSNGKTCQ